MIILIIYRSYIEQNQSLTVAAILIGKSFTELFVLYGAQQKGPASGASRES